MEKTADLAMVQKTNIDTLSKEAKSQRVITERGGCLQSLQPIGGFLLNVSLNHHN